MPMDALFIVNSSFYIVLNIKTSNPYISGLGTCPRLTSYISLFLMYAVSQTFGFFTGGIRKFTDAPKIYL